MTCSSSPYEAAWPPIGPPRTRTLGSHGAMPKRSSCSGLAAKQVVVVGVRGRAPFHLAGCLGAQELSHCTPSSTHLLCCRVAIARWLRCDPPCAFSISITVPCTPVRAGGDPIRIVSARLSGVDRVTACRKDRLIFASGQATRTPQRYRMSRASRSIRRKCKTNSLHASGS